MSYSPINVRKLKKMGYLNEDKFFQELANRCNYMSEENARIFYGELVRLVTKEMKEKGVCRLPNLGDFAIMPLKPQMKLHGRVKKKVFDGISLKFYPNVNWRKYFEYRKNDNEKHWYKAIM